MTSEWVPEGRYRLVSTTGEIKAETEAIEYLLEEFEPGDSIEEAWVKVKRDWHRVRLEHVLTPKQLEEIKMKGKH